MSSFSEADGETPRMSYSLVSTTFAMMLTGYTERPSAELQPREEPTQDSPAGTERGLPDTTTDSNTHSETDAKKQQPYHFNKSYVCECVVIFINIEQNSNNTYFNHNVSNLSCFYYYGYQNK